jgi:acetyl esterase/lipase
MTGDHQDPAVEGTVGEAGPPGPPGAVPGPEPEQASSAVQGVIDWYGPADLVALAAASGGPMEHDSPSSPEGRLIGGQVSAHPALAKAASPVSYAQQDAPPFLIKHGTADTSVPISQSQALADALRARSVRVETEWVAGADHMWLGIPPARVEEIVASSVEFAKRVTSW